MSGNNGSVSGHVPIVNSRLKTGSVSNLSVTTCTSNRHGANLWLNSRQNSTASHLPVLSAARAAEVAGGSSSSQLNFIGKPGFLSPNFANQNNQTGTTPPGTVTRLKNDKTRRLNLTDSVRRDPPPPLESIVENYEKFDSVLLTPTKLTRNQLSFSSNLSDSPKSDKKQSLSGRELLSRTTSVASSKGAPSEASLSWRDIFTILGICFGNFILGCAYALPAPFFPFEAEKKGVPSSQYGFVYSTIEFGVFILSPIYGKLIPRISPRFLVCFGLIQAGLCEVSFGLLHLVPGEHFVWVAIGIRALEAVGAAAFFTACYTLIAMKFTSRVSRLFAYTEMSSGVGMIAGPAVGGFLYELGDKIPEVGGFSLPFFLTGSLMSLGGLLLWAMVSPIKQTDDEVSCSLVSVFNNWNLIVNLLVSVNCFFLIGFSDSTLEPHIREFFDLSVSTIGLIFIIPGIIYTPTSHLWGKLCDKAPDTYLFSAFGCLMGLMSYIFLGPFPFIDIEPTIWMIIVGQIFIGVGMGGMLVSSFVQGIRETIANGFDNGISTYAVVAGLFSSAFSLGSTIGPSIGGIMAEYIGYRNSTGILVLIQAIMIVTLLGHKWYISRPGRTPRSVNLPSCGGSSMSSSECDSDIFDFSNGDLGALRSSISSSESGSLSSTASKVVEGESADETPAAFTDHTSGLWSERMRARTSSVSLISYKTRGNSDLFITSLQDRPERRKIPSISVIDFA